METKVKIIKPSIEGLYVRYKRSFKIFYNYYKEDHKPNLNVTINDYIVILDFISHQHRNRGGLDTIRLIKHIRLILYKSLADDVIPEGPFFKVDKSGLPSIFTINVKNAVKLKDHHTIRCLLTLLQISYLIDDVKAPKIEPIIAPYTGSNDALKAACSWVMDNYKRFFFVPPKSFWNEPHSSTKAGPLGPAVWTIPNELFLMSDKLRKNLKLLGGPKFGIWLDNCYESRDYLLKSQDYIYQGEIQGKYRNDSLRRITFVKAPEGKARVIAILDWWSQTVLKSIHNWSFDQLRALKTDATFNQGSFLEILPKVGPYFSFDLTGATDRFPVAIQKAFMSKVLGEERASAWHSILCDEEFLVGWTNEYVKYSVGQPMGAYSSWSIFSLCHHLIVQYSAELVLNRTNFKDYCILGDDIVIANEKVARSYEAVITSLGVQIDKTKSLVSKDTYEFAKRIIHKGKEITAFPLSAMIDNVKSISALWSTTIVVRERGFNIPAVSYPGLIASIQLANDVRFAKSKRLAMDFEALHIIKEGYDHEYLAWAIKHMHDRIARYLPCGTNERRQRYHLVYDLGYFTMKYKAALLENRYKRFQHLTFQLTGETFGKGGIESMGSQAHAPIDLMRVPIVWISRVAINEQQREVSNLKGALDRGDFDELLRMKISPIGDLNKIVSRQVNLKSTAMQSRVIKHFIAEQRNLNNLLEAALNPQGQGNGEAKIN